VVRCDSLQVGRRVGDLALSTVQADRLQATTAFGLSNFPILRVVIDFCEQMRKRAVTKRVHQCHMSATGQTDLSQRVCSSYHLPVISTRAMTSAPHLNNASPTPFPRACRIAIIPFLSSF